MHSPYSISNPCGNVSKATIENPQPRTASIIALAQMQSEVSGNLTYCLKETIEDSVSWRKGRDLGIID